VKSRWGLFPHTIVLAALATFAVPPGVAEAGTLSVGGVSFSDELGGFVLERLTGEGTLADPFIVTERITDSDGCTLVIRVDPLYGNQIGTQHAIGFALTKVVENGTRLTWTSFELELQSTQGVPSSYSDGLSFGQGSSAGRPFTAAGFEQVTLIDEPYDRIEYDRGKIAVGGQATLRLVVTESMPLATAYLVQRPRRPIANGATVRGKILLADSSPHVSFFRQIFNRRA
jgi:hypothetical protein